MNHDKQMKDNGASKKNANTDPLRFGSAAAYLAAGLRAKEVVYIIPKSRIL